MNREEVQKRLNALASDNTDGLDDSTELLDYVESLVKAEVSAARKDLAERVTQGRHTIRRLHRIIKNMIDNDDGETTVLLEVWADMEPPRMGVTICAPGMDEEQIGKAMAKWMHSFNSDRDSGLAIDETKTVLSEDVKENPPWVVELRKKTETLASFVVDFVDDKRSGVHEVFHGERIDKALAVAKEFIR